MLLESTFFLNSTVLVQETVIVLQSPDKMKEGVISTAVAYSL